jgi:hypothetical protein
MAVVCNRHPLNQPFALFILAKRTLMAHTPDFSCVHPCGVQATEIRHRFIKNYPRIHANLHEKN